MAEKRRGRRSKLTANRQEIIVDLIGKGHFASTAAAMAGIKPNTLLHWLERGEEETRGIYHEFFMAVRQAEAKAETAAVQKLEQLAEDEGDWRGIAWLLERRHRARWGRPAVQPAAQVNVQGERVAVVADGEKSSYIEALRQVRVPLATDKPTTPPPAQQALIVVEPEKEDEA